MARTYRLKKRAERQAQTRARIVRAAVDLHGEVGPAHTSIRAIADRAGVQRATVYDHFPDEPSLFEACTSHYLDRHPPPDPRPWREVSGRIGRLGAALTDIYNYFGRVEPMMTKVYRDAEQQPLVWQTEASRSLARYWEGVGSQLVADWVDEANTSRAVVAAMRHALHFETWRLLVREQGLATPEAVALMVQLVCGAERLAPGPAAS